MDDVVCYRKFSGRFAVSVTNLFFFVYFLFFPYQLNCSRGLSPFTCVGMFLILFIDIVFENKSIKSYVYAG